MRNIVYDYDQVVFGSNMHALLYAYVNQIPLFYSSLDKPRQFDFFDPSFSFANINNVNTIICESQERIFGMKKIHLWEDISFVLGFDGLMPLGDNVSSVRIDEDLLKITTKTSRLIKVKFNHLFVFDESIEGLPPIQRFNNDGIVYDYFKFDTLHEYKNMLIETKEDFANQIWINGNQGVVVTKTDDISSDIPDYAIRFKVLELAQQYGIKGRQNGIYHYRKELKIPRFKKLDIKIRTRETLKTKMNIYSPKENLTFIEPSAILESELLSKLTKNRTWNQLSR